MSTEQALAEVKVLGTLVNEALEAADDLRDAVRIIRDKRDVLANTLAAAVPRASFDTSYGLNVKHQRVHDALRRLTQPLADFELKAGAELSEQQIATALHEIKTTLRTEA